VVNTAERFHPGWGDLIKIDTFTHFFASLMWVEAIVGFSMEQQKCQKMTI